jgi:hypothetical protein
MDSSHNPKVRGSNPCPATRKIKGFAEVAALFCKGGGIEHGRLGRKEKAS